ncbi:MAG: TIGR02147 family protein [Bdellovibrio sp.]
MNMKTPPPFLRQVQIAFNRKKRQNYRFSWRQLALKLEVSNAFLSQIMKGKRKIPIDKLDSLINALEMDEFAERRLFYAYFRELDAEISTKSLKAAKYIKERNQHQPADKTFIEPFDEIPSEGSHFPMFEPWYHAAILDLAETEDFRPDPYWISKRLAIQPHQAEQALSLALQHGFLKQVGDKITKSKKTIRNSAKSSSKMMRSFYSEMLTKTQVIMNRKTSLEDFQERLIMGVTCSANSKIWPQIKAQMTDQLFSNAVQLASGDCQQVYCLATIAIPLSKKIKE